MNWNVGYDLFQRNTVLVGRNLFSVSLAIPPQYWFECRMEIFTAFVFFFAFTFTENDCKIFILIYR